MSNIQRHFKALCTIKEKPTDVKLKSQFKSQQFAWNQNNESASPKAFLLNISNDDILSKYQGAIRNVFQTSIFSIFPIGSHIIHRNPSTKYTWTLKSGHHGPTEGAQRQRSELRIDREDSERPARKQTGLQCSCSTFGQQLSWENQGGDERRKKTAQSTVCPCALRTSPFCFSTAAGPDWLIASLIQFSRALLQRLSTFIRIL